MIINDEKILATKGDIIFIHDGMFHGGTPNNCIYECIVFDIKILLKQNHACIVNELNNKGMKIIK